MVDTVTTLREYIASGYQLLQLTSTEEARAITDIRNTAKLLQFDVVTWDCHQGYSSAPGVREFKNPQIALTTLYGACEMVAEQENQQFPNNAIYVFKDLDDFFEDPQVRRCMRTLAGENMLNSQTSQRPIIILSPVEQVHKKLKSLITVIQHPLPDEPHLNQVVDMIVQASGNKYTGLTEELREKIVNNMLGLTVQESEDCLARCITRHAGFSEAMLSTIKDEKASIVRRSEVLTYIPDDSAAKISEIGGYDNYLGWLARRQLAYTKQAREEKIDFPKGVVLIGIPGTGKSLVAKATCQQLQLPGYILDVGALFGSLVGQSEQRTRDALKQIDAQKGCVVVIDEADKALGGSHNAQGDSGVSRRILGSILSWLADNQSKTFCIMTLNRTDGLPPELLRAGRFDEVFYTDLPDATARKQIIDIHLRKRGVEPANLEISEEEWVSIIAGLDKFVGAELEAVVKEARYLAMAKFGHGRPGYEQFLSASQAVKPLALKEATQINEMLTECRKNATPVHLTTISTTNRTRHRKLHT